MMESTWQLLKESRNDPEWNANHKGALKSQMAGRQWSQHRVFKAGWSEHNRCITWLSTIVDSESPGADQCLITVRGPVVATAEQIEKAPVGKFNHRIWKGQCNEALRNKLAPHCDVQDVRGCNVEGHPARGKGSGRETCPAETKSVALRHF